MFYVRALGHKDIYGNEYYKMPRVTNKQDLLMSTLTLFYQNPDNLHKILPIVQGKTRISLRLIDWFVTNYSKKENVMFPVEKSTFNGEKKVSQFIVHTNYKSQLKAYSKRHFDPFCRGDNIRFCYDDHKSILTTVGQLNFFRWIIDNGILEYMENNLTDIERDMTKSQKTPTTVTKQPEADVKTHRKQLSVSATRTMLKHEVKMTVDFAA